jgi:hypothetical protein
MFGRWNYREFLPMMPISEVYFEILNSTFELKQKKTKYG